MTDEEQFLVYTAGFFDADGSVGVYPRRHRNRPSSRSYWLRASVAQRRHLSIFAEWTTRWGGSLSEDKRGEWRWVVASAQARRFLEDILPFLRNKQPQAKLAIEFQQQKKPNRSRKRLSDKEAAYQKDVCARLKAMKRR